jgi:hypothetical protein
MDKDETQDAKDSRYPIKNPIKSTAGNPVTITQLPIVVAGNDPPDKSKVGQMDTEWPTKWFTLTDCAIGRVVRSMLYHPEEEFMDMDASRTTLWYQIA